MELNFLIDGISSPMYASYVELVGGDTHKLPEDPRGTLHS